MKGYRAAEEAREKSHSVNQNRPQHELRSGMPMGGDSAESIQRGGGEDPRRHEAKIMIDRTVMDHDQSGYNHNGVKAPEAAMGNNEHMAKMESRAMHMGTPHPDGTYSR